MQHSTLKILSVYEQFINQEFCYQLARKHRFIQRSSSKIQGFEFINTLILPSKDLSADSLDGLCLRLKSFNPNIDISASALSQRINTISAVNMMKDCMQEILRVSRGLLLKQYTSINTYLGYFNNVYIHDSTVFELNKKLSKIFKGTKRGGKKGNVSCKAQVKIDLFHNLTTGVITEAKIYEGKRPDQALTRKILKVVKENDLVIRDLGYFKLDVLKSIANAKAFFLSRFPSHLTVYLNEKDKNPINLAQHLNKNYKNFAAISINVFVGAGRLPVRLVAYRVPVSVKNERLRKSRKGAREMGRTLSKAKLDLLQFSLFITNIPEDCIPTEMIGTIYRIRWEIELIFKQWKSLLKIDVIKGISQYRIKVLIWSRLCMAILISVVTARFLNLANMYCTGELSPTKLIEYLMRNGKLSEAVRLNKVEELENEIIYDMKRRLLKNKRARKTMRENIINLTSYYESVDNTQKANSLMFMLA